MTDMPTPPPYFAAGPVKLLPFSKSAIAGFVISCVSIFFFGILAVAGIGFSVRGFRDARKGVVRGRGLAIAGMIIGLVAFVFYVVSFIIRAN